MLHVVRLDVSDAVVYRDLRLDALRACPETFGAAWEEEAARPLTWFAERLERSVVFGAEAVSDPVLAGMVGFFVQDGAKLRHKGVLWGLFVRPEARRTGLGASLVAHVVAYAERSVEELRLTVNAGDAAAIGLYERAGFETYGLERRALKVGAEYQDETLMALSLHRPRTPAKDGRPSQT